MNRTVVLMLVGLGLRLFLIFPGPLESKVEFLTNKADLRNYYWPAQAALRGENPYALWASGQSGEYRADMAPLELMIYVAAVAVWNDPRAIQILFALFDALNIGLLGLVLRASPLKLPFQVFYALGPLTLYNLVLVPEDKTIVLTLTFLIFYLLTLSKDYVLRFTSLRFTRVLLIILAAGLLAGFKWLSVFYLLPLLLHVSPNVRAFVRNGVIFTAVVLLTHLPWIPSWSYVYAFRSARTATPLHIAPAALLNGAGLFNPTVFMVALGAALIGIYALFWFKRIDIFETIVLCMAVGILWTPDMDPVHLSIVVIGFLMVVNWTRGIRPFLVWGLSFWVTAVYAVSTHSGFVRSGWPNLQLVSGEYGSSQMIVLSYALFVAVFAFYVFDKWRARAVGGALIGAELPR
ncbi:MAG: hypothetical protein HY782_07975 [Chloroflexi bacterium]|nr:hypothetical protein [Chloroflexota bacterium]